MNKSHKFCIEMLEQRNYIIDTDTDTDTDISIKGIKPDGEHMVVFFSEVPKFTVKNIQLYISIMNDIKIRHAIIVYKECVTAHTRKAINKSLDIKFELFAEEDLQYNITKHRLQPVFEKLQEHLAVAFKKKFGIKFGIMRYEDPIARFYGYEQGDVIRVIRDGETKFITYRLVK